MRKRARTLLAGVLSGVLLTGFAGCERGQTAGPATAPATDPQPSSAVITRVDPAAVTAATQPAVRPPSVVLIDQKPITFPPAILQVRTRDNQLLAILMSDDPKDAIDDAYRGNSFYLEMPLEATDIKDLSEQVYRFNSPSSERTDSPNGIFLDGNRLQLQPRNLQVQFEGDEKQMTVHLTGQFLVFDIRDDAAPTKTVNAVGQLGVVVKVKS